MNNAAGITVNTLNVTSPAATLALAGGTFTLAGAGTLSAGTLVLNGGTLTGGTLTLADSANLSVVSRSYVSNAVYNNGTLSVASGAQYMMRGGSLTNNKYLNLNYSGSGLDPIFCVTALGNLTNNGTIVFNGSGYSAFDMAVVQNSATLLINSGFLGINQNTITFNGANYVGGSAGTFSISNSDFIAGGGWLTNNGTLTLAAAHNEIDGSILSNNGNIIFKGPSDFLAGTLGGGGSYSIPNGSAGTFGGTESYIHYLASTLNNNGTLNLAAGHWLTLANGTLNNAGYLNILNNANDNIYVGEGTVTSNLITNTGTINTNVYVNINTNLANNGGTINVASGSLNFLGSGTFTGASVINGAGTLTLQPSSVIAIPSGTLTLNVPLTEFTAGSINLGAAALNVTNRFNWLIGNIVGSGSMNIAANATLAADGQFYGTLGTTLNNNGTMLLSGGMYLGLSSGTINNAGYFNASLGSSTYSSQFYATSTTSLFRNTGTIALSNGSFSFAVPLNNAGGTISVASGTLSLSGLSNTYSGSSYLKNAGAILFAGPTTFSGGAMTGSGTYYNTSTFNTGSLSGTRTINAPFINSGTVNLTGTAAFALQNGTFTNNGTLAITADSAGTATPFTNTAGTAYLLNSGTLISGNASGMVQLPSWFSNTGTLIAATTTNVPSAIPQISATTLNGGRWIVQNNATLSFTPSVALTSNAATVVLQGTAQFPALNSLINNTGTIRLSGGNNLILNQPLLNYGTIVTDSASTLSLNSNLINGGVINGDVRSGANITLNNSTTLYVDSAAGVSVSSYANALVGHLRANAITVGSQGVLTTYALQGAQGTDVTNTLDLSATGSRFDLSDNALIVDYSASSPLNTITQYLAKGFAAGWKSSSGSGLVSTSAAGLAHRALGVAESALALSSSGGTFSGQTVDASAVLVKYTYSGDANLDGKVDVVDLGLLASHWQQTGGWYQGDFNYDGKIDVVDLGQLASAWQLGTTGPQLSFAQALATVDFTTPVPEPAGLGVLSLALLGFARKRTARQTPRSSRTSASARRASGRSAA